MNRCVTDIEFGTEGQEIKCFSRKKMKNVSTMLKNIVSDVSLSCLSWMRWAMKVLNWTKHVRLGATMLGRHGVFVCVVVSWILGLNVACRVCSTMIMTRLKEALWVINYDFDMTPVKVVDEQFLKIHFAFAIQSSAKHWLSKHWQFFSNWRLTKNFKNCQFFADDCIEKSSEFSLVMTFSICQLTKMAGRTIIFIWSRNG